MLMLMCSVALATDLPGPAEGDLRLGAWLTGVSSFDTTSLPELSLIGGARVGISDRLSVAFPAVFRFQTLETGDGELVLVGGLSSLGYSSNSGLSESFTMGVEGYWSLEWADAVAWADVGIEAVPSLDDLGFKTVSSWSVGVAPVVELGEHWRLIVPMAVSGSLGDSEQSLSIGVVDPDTWRWRTPQTFGGVPQPTVAYSVNPQWSLEGYLGATLRAGGVRRHIFAGLSYHW
jgi:hypothetical protein